MPSRRPPDGPVDLHKIYPSTADPVLHNFFRADDRWTELVAVKVNELVTEGTGGTGGIPEAPVDGKQYGRQSAAWTVVPPPVPGPAGPQGPAGPPGTSLNMLDYVFSTAVTPLIVNGRVQLNATNQTAATLLWADHITNANNDATIALNSIASGEIVYIQDKTDSTVYQKYIATANAVDRGYYTEIAVAWQSGGTPLSNNESVFFGIVAQGQPGPAGPAGPGVPTGGSTGQVLEKNSATNFDTSWQTLPAVPGPATTLPLMDGAAAIGTSLLYTRTDHVHPSDTSRLALAGGTMTGTLTLAADPAANLQPVTLQYYNAHLPAVPAPSATLPVMDGTAAVGVVTTYARGDHVHPSDTSRVALTGGTMTGAIAMSSNKITGLANGTVATDAAAFGQIPSVPVASSTLPLMDGTAAIGVGTTWARADHVHPSDTSRLALSGGTMSGVIAMGANKITGIANGSAAQDAAAFGQIPLASSTTPLADGTAAVGTSATWARADHVHPTSGGGGTITGVTAGTGLTGGGTSGTVTVAVASAGITNALLATMGANTIKGNNTGAVAAPLDLTTAQIATMLNLAQYAPLASPTFTGIPAAPTPATADNTTQLATTAFVKAQAYLTGNQSVTLTGDVTGSGATSIAATVAGLQGRAVAATAPTTNQVLQWSGTQWAPATPAGGGTITGVTAGTGLTGGGTSGTVTVAVASAGITNALLATMPTMTLKGNNAGSTAAPVDLTAAQLNTMFAYTGSPVMDGTASPGSTNAWARGDHIHPTDTTRQAALSLVSQQIAFGAASGGGIAQDAQLLWDPTNKMLVVGPSPSIQRLFAPSGFTRGDYTVNAKFIGGVWSFDDTTKPAFDLVYDQAGAQISFGYAPASANPPVWTTLATLAPTGFTTAVPVGLVSPLTVNGPVATERKIIGTTNGSNRFYIDLASATAETGSNAGSDFQINACNDSGAFLGQPIAIKRSTQIVTFSQPIVNGSDARLKENVEPIADALDKVMALKGVSYNRIGQTNREIGLIAQDVQPIVPEVVHETPAPPDENGNPREASPSYLGISYGQLTALLVEAVKTLTARVEQVAAR